MKRIMILLIAIVLVSLAGCAKPRAEQNIQSQISPKKSQIAQYQELYGYVLPGFYSLPIPESSIYEVGGIFLRRYTKNDLEIIEIRSWPDGEPYIFSFVKLPTSLWNNACVKIVEKLKDPNSVSEYSNSLKQELIDTFSYQAKGPKVWLFDIRFDEVEYAHQRNELIEMDKIMTNERLNRELGRHLGGIENALDGLLWEQKFGLKRY